MRGGEGWMGLTGCRDQRLVFKNNQTNILASGEPIISYVTAFETWGGHRDLKGKEREVFGQESAEAMAVFVIRYQSGIPKTDMIIEWRGQQWEIMAPPIELGNKDGWQIFAKVRRAVP